MSESEYGFRREFIIVSILFSLILAFTLGVVMGHTIAHFTYLGTMGALLCLDGGLAVLVLLVTSRKREKRDED